MPYASRHSDKGGTQTTEMKAISPKIFKPLISHLAEKVLGLTLSEELPWCEAATGTAWLSYYNYPG